MHKTTAEELVARFGMSPHVENGSYIEKHFAYDGEGRAPSGSIYYYVAPDERTEFHVIDCGEYWCYTAGSPLDIWLVDKNGTVTVKKLGIDEGCEPFVYVESGTIFASKHFEKYDEGTFLCCITVPRFDPDGFRLIEKDEMLKICPQAKEFYE